MYEARNLVLVTLSLRMILPKHVQQPKIFSKYGGFSVKGIAVVVNHSCPKLTFCFQASVSERRRYCIIYYVNKMIRAQGIYYLQTLLCSWEIFTRSHSSIFTWFVCESIWYDQLYTYIDQYSCLLGKF